MNTERDIETVRQLLTDHYRGGSGHAPPQEAFDRIERVVEAVKEFWPQFEHDFKAHLYDERAQVVPFWHKANALREALGALGALDG